MCRVLAVTRSADYAWARRGVAARARADEALTVRSAAASVRRRTDGAPRIHAELRAQGARCAYKRVARPTRAAAPGGCRRRRRARTTTIDPAQPPAPKLVARDYTVPVPDRLWIGDSTPPPTGEGWWYLAVLLDAHSRRVIGRALADHLRMERALRALAIARRARRPGSSLVHHTHRGGQYTAAAYQARLAACGITCSMRRAARAGIPRWPKTSARPARRNSSTHGPGRRAGRRDSRPSHGSRSGTTTVAAARRSPTAAPSPMRSRWCRCTISPPSAMLSVSTG